MLFNRSVITCDILSATATNLNFWLFNLQHQRQESSSTFENTYLLSDLSGETQFLCYVILPPVLLLDKLYIVIISSTKGLCVCVCVCFAGTSLSREMAEVGALQRLPERKPAQRIPAGGNELVTVQLVQQVSTAHTQNHSHLLQIYFDIKNSHKH